MPTKFYLEDATTSVAGTLPSAILGGTPVVTATGAATNRAMDTVPGTSQASGQTTTNGTANSQLHVFRRWISPPLAAQTIPIQTIALHIGTAEANAASNFIPTFYLAVWRPGTGAVIASGVLTDISAIVGVEPGTTQTATTISGSSARAVTTQQGDVLVLEMWRGTVAPGAATARTNTVYYDGTTEDSTSSNAAYIGFTNDVALYFAPQAIGAVGAIASAGAMGTAGRVNLPQPVTAVGAIASGQAFGSPAPTYRASVMATPNLLGYWRLGEASNTLPIADELGANPGAYVNDGSNPSPTMGLAGPINDGNSAALWGNGTWGNVPAAVPLIVTDVWTIEAWIKLNATTAGIRGILSKGQNGAYLRVEANGYLVVVKGSVAILAGQAAGTGPLTAGVWHHVVGTKNGAAMHLYVDGVDVTGIIYDTQATLDTAFAWTIGADIFSANNHREPMYGGLDEVALYGRDLTAAEVLAHYNAAASPYRQTVMATSGLAGYWRLGETAGTTAVDETGVNNGTWNGSPVRGVAGATADGNSGFTMNGASAVTVGHNASLNLGDVFTLEAWINFQGTYPAAGGRGIISKGGGSYYMRTDSTGAVMLLSSQVAQLLQTTVKIPVTGWHHVVCTKSGATSRAYIDGVDVTPSVTNSTLGNNTGSLFIGCDAFGGGNEFMQGSIDEAAVYNVALTPQQVLTHYRAAPSLNAGGTGMRVSQPVAVSAVGGIKYGWRFPIVAVDPAGTGRFWIDGDWRGVLAYSIGFDVVGSTGANGSYSPSTVGYGAGQTVITVYEDVTTSIADGFICVLPHASNAAVVSRGARPVSAVGAVASAGALGLPVVAGGWRVMAFSPAPGTGGDSADAEIRREVASAGEALFSLRTGSGTHMQPATDQGYYLRLDAGTSSPNYAYLSRIFMSFATNLLPAGAVLKAVRLHLGAVAGQSNLGAGFGYNVVSGGFLVPAVPQISDYASVGTNLFSTDVPYSTFLTGVNDVAFNAAGVAWVDGVRPTTLALRSTFDLGSAVPTWSVAATSFMQFASGDYTPGPFSPVLYVSYDVAAPVQSVTAVGGVATGAVAGAAVVTVGLRTVTAVGNVATAAALGTATVARGARPITAAGGVGTASAFGLPVVVRGGRTLTVVGAIPSSGAFGQSVVTRGTRAVGAVGAVASATSFGTATVTRAGDLNRYVSNVGMVPSGVGFGSAAVGRGPMTLQSVGILSAFTMGSAKVAVVGVSVSSVGGIASLVSLGVGTVTGLNQFLFGVSLASVEAYGTGSTSMVIQGQALEVRDYEGVGSVAVATAVSESLVGWRNGPANEFLIPFTPLPNRYYGMWVLAGGYFGPQAVLQSVTHPWMTLLHTGSQGSNSDQMWFGLFGTFDTVSPGDLRLYFSNIFGAAPVHYLILDFGAAATFTGGVLRAGPNFALSSGALIAYVRTGYVAPDLSVQFMRSTGPISVAPYLSSTQQTGGGKVTRAAWVAAETVSATGATASGFDPNQLGNVEVIAAVTDTPIWLSGVRIGTQIAFGQGTVAAPSTVLGGVSADFSVPLNQLPGGFVCARTITGVGANFSSPVGALGLVQPGIHMTFVPVVRARASILTSPPGGSHLVLPAVVAPVGQLNTNYIVARSAHAFVRPVVGFHVAYRPKRALADIKIRPVTVADVVIGAVTRASIMVNALLTASVRVTRDEDELMSERDEFDIGDVARVTATITLDGVLKDPVSVSFQWRSPDGLVTTSNTIRVSPGVYYGDIPCQQPGRHWWRLAGSPDASFGEEGAIRVRRSAVLDT